MYVCELKIHIFFTRETMHLALVGFVLFLSHPLFAVDLYIYKSVTEIRKIQSGFSQYQQFFGNNEYENIIESSINWNGTPFTKQELYNKIDTLKNALVTIRHSNLLGYETIEAKIIDPNTMLLQNLETRGYFYADHHSIEYKSCRPDTDGTVLRFQFKKNTRYEGILSYLMKGISWSPDYNLLIEDADSKFFIDLLFKINKYIYIFLSLKLAIFEPMPIFTIISKANTKLIILNYTVVIFK